MNSGDTDLYVSKHPLLFPNCHQHEWSSHDIDSNFLILNSSLRSGTYSIGVYGFKGMKKYKMSVRVQENSKLGPQKLVSSSSSMQEDTVECGNCKHFIPTRSIALHEVFCRRHNVVCQHVGCGIVLKAEEAKNHVHCDKCGQAFQLGEVEKHMKVFHEPLSCPCGAVLKKTEMLHHQASVCPLRLVTCRFCGDMVQAGSSAIDLRDRMRGLSEHEIICGSRTAPCDSCGHSVMLKDMDIHQIAVHQKNRIEKCKNAGDSNGEVTSQTTSSSSSLPSNLPLLSAFLAFAIAQFLKFFTTWSDLSRISFHMQS